MSMTDFQIIEFARGSADMAFDQRNADHYSASFTAFDSYQDNLIDTMTEHRVQGFVYHEAIALYATRYAELSKKL